MLAAGEPLYGYTLGPGETLHWIDTPEDLARTAAALQGITVHGKGRARHTTKLYP